MKRKKKSVSRRLPILAMVVTVSALLFIMVFERIKGSELQVLVDDVSVKASLPRKTPATVTLKQPPDITMLLLEASEDVLAQIDRIRNARGSPRIEVVVCSCERPLGGEGDDRHRHSSAVRHVTSVDCGNPIKPAPAARFLTCAREARGEIVAFLDPLEPFAGRDSPLTISWVRTVVDRLTTNPTKSVLGPVLALPNGTVLGAGIGAVLWTKTDVTLFRQKSGVSRRYFEGGGGGGGNGGDVLDAFVVPLAGSVSKRSTWTEGFLAPSEFSHDPAIAEAQLFEEALQRGATFGALLSYSLGVGNAPAGSTDLVDALWAQRRIPGMAVGHARARQIGDVSVVWDLYCSCTGVNIEAINFLVPLEGRVRLAAIAGPECFCPGYPRFVADALRRIRERQVEDPPTIWVSHKPPGNYPTFPYHGGRRFENRPRIVIGRSMSEWAPISDEWVKKAELVDELWVPTAWHAGVFSRAGIPWGKIRVIPEAIDVRLFDPEHTEALDLGIPDPGSVFKFLSVFKMETRKGWDVLVDAYFHEFTAADPVILIIHTHMYQGLDKRNAEKIREVIERKVSKKCVHSRTLSRAHFLQGNRDWFHRGGRQGRKDLGTVQSDHDRTQGSRDATVVSRR